MVRLRLIISRFDRYNIKDLMTIIKMHISKVKLPFYPQCEVKCRLQNGVSKGCIGLFSVIFPMCLIVGAMRGITLRLSGPGRRKDKTESSPSFMAQEPFIQHSYVEGLILQLEYGFGVQVWLWEGVRHLKLPNLWVGFHSLCLTS